MRSRFLPEPAGDVAVLHHLRHYRFDMQATAKALGWDRSTVTQRLKGLCFQALVESEGDQAKAASVLAGDPALLRTVELKVMDYMGHLMETIEPFKTAGRGPTRLQTSLQKSCRSGISNRSRYCAEDFLVRRIRRFERAPSDPERILATATARFEAQSSDWRGGRVCSGAYPLLPPGGSRIPLFGS